MNPGDSVRLLAPFDEFFIGTYIVESIDDEIAGGPAVHLVGIDPVFHPRYLEVIS